MRHSMREKKYFARLGSSHGCATKPLSDQCHAEGGATKGGVSKCEQTQANADKRGQTQANAEAQTQANASKREQTWTSANKRLHPPLLRFFTPPFAIPLSEPPPSAIPELRWLQDRRYSGGSASLFGITWKVSVAIFVVRASGQA